MVAKGCFWIVLGVITVVAMFMAGMFSCPWCITEWCNDSINAGYCEKNPDDKKCYCIDATMTKTQEIDLYAYSQSECELRNGTLAAPDDNNTLLWLSKRMYTKGVDNAMVALLRDPQEGWYWSKGETKQSTQVFWRQDVPHDPEHLHAMLTVQTVITDREYDYTAYNYDHYIDVDPNYQWFGLTTSDNKPNHRLGTYYICTYTIKPQVEIAQVQNTTLPNVDNKDPCFCAANERIELPELNSHAIFTSPRYPNNYCSDNHCKWTIITAEGLNLQIKSIVFSTEKKMDFVYIYDGDNDDSPLMQACSATDCDDHKSSGPAMQVHFSADHVITELGFKFKVTAIKPDVCYCSESLHMSITNIGETFIFNSPRHPDPYCSNLKCGWTIAAPEGHVVDIKWDRFETENDRAYLLAHELIDDMDVLKQNCTGTDCAGIRSSGGQIRLEFVSDNHTSKAVGFRAIARVVKNYCAIHAHKVPAGTVTSSSPPREDGYISAGTKVTVTCPEKYKIRNTVEAFTDSAVCDAPQWSKLLQICVPVCQLEYSVHYSMDGVNLCSFGQNVQTTLVEHGHNVQVNTYDYYNGNILKDTKNYTCGESGWLEQPPVCHPMGIVSFGYSSESTKRAVELYTPADKMNTRLLPTQLLSDNDYYAISTTAGGGPILVVGGTALELSATTGFAFKFTPYVELLDINKNTSTPGPEMNEGRASLGAANLNGVIFVCGGDVNVMDSSNICERFQNGIWTMSAPMKEARIDFKVVAMDKWLYTIGGWSWVSASSTVERYSVGTDNWEFVQPMIRARVGFGAAALDGSIYVCGGRDQTIMQSCEQYSPPQDQWQFIASMKVPRLHFSLVAFDGALYAAGGFVIFPYYDITTADKTATIEKPDHNEWSIVAKLTGEKAFVQSVVTSFFGNIPSDAESQQPQSLPYQVDLSALAKLTETEPEWTNNAPIVIDSNSPHMEDACACLSNEGIVLEGLEDSKTFQSPGYPDHYCNNNKCLWTISVSGTESLAIQLEWVSFSTEYQMDMAFVYEGDGDNVRLVHVCSGSHCSSHLSHEDTMQVYFSSDHVATDIGFKATVTAVDPDPCHCYQSKEISLSLSHIESYILLSPNYPNSYCANVEYDCTWTITVLPGYGPEIMWHFFNLGRGDVLSIYSGIELLKECTGGFCSDLVSPGEELIIHFMSKGSATDQNQQQAFSATISVVRNYCHKLSTHLGAIKYDRETRDDGHLPTGTQALFTCPANYTVANAVDQATSNLTCIAPHWDNDDEPLVCESVCPLEFANPTSWSDIHVCAYDDLIPRTLVPNGHKIISERHDFMNDVLLSGTNFECRNMEWIPAAPTCHKLGIFMIGGGIIEIYWPMENISTVSGGGPFTDDSSTSRQTHIIHIATGQVSEGPMMLEEHGNGASATLGGELYVCGGTVMPRDITAPTAVSYSASCEVLKSGNWVPMADMKQRRGGFAMAATNDALYVMGGVDGHLYLSSVEKYTRETNTWTGVAPMPEMRSGCAAVEYNNVIYLCGGLGVENTQGKGYETKSCMKYDTHLDVWHHIDDLPSSRAYFSMVVMGSRIFALGGEVYDIDLEQREAVMTIDGLDIETEQWTKQGQLQLPHRGPSAVVVPQYEMRNG